MKKGILKNLSLLIGALMVSSFSGFNLVQASAVTDKTNSVTQTVEFVIDDMEYFEELLDAAKKLEVNDNDADKEFFDVVYKSYGDYAKKIGRNLNDQQLKEAVNILVLMNYESSLSEVFKRSLDYLGLDIDSYIDVVFAPVYKSVITEMDKEFYRLILNTNYFEPSKLDEKDMKVYKELKDNVNVLVSKYLSDHDFDDSFVETISSLIWNLANSSVKLSSELLVNVMVTLDLDTKERFLELAGPFAEKFEPFITDDAITLGYLGMYYFDCLLDSIDTVQLEKLINQLYKREITSGEFSRKLIDSVEFEYIDSEDVDIIVDILYFVLLLREADEEGMKFWVNKYNEELGKSKSREEAFKSVAYGMMETEEFKNIDLLSEFDIF